MTSWCPNDKSGFLSANLGQINPNDKCGQTLAHYVRTNQLANIVDIGTWNGMGSTLCFLVGLQGNTTTQLITLEINREKVENAKKNLQPYIGTTNTDFVWGSVISSDEIVDMPTIFPEFVANTEFQRWHSIDVANIDASPNVLHLIPETIDFILFDGGEFTTYYEFMKLFPRCVKFIALDDVLVSKCAKIRAFLSAHSEWTEIQFLNYRNGFSLFQKKTV
jgi:hypothetical protein